MRTNGIDATAYRCLSEYNTLVNIYSLIYKKNYDYHIKDYLEELSQMETPKEIRDRHNKRMGYVKDRCRLKLGEVAPPCDAVLNDELSCNDYKLIIEDDVKIDDGDIIPIVKSGRGKDKKPRKINKNIKLTDAEEKLIPITELKGVASPAINFQLK